jgi:hypothetical protein
MEVHMDIAASRNSSALNKLGLFLIFLCIYSLSINHVLLSSDDGGIEALKESFSSLDQHDVEQQLSKKHVRKASFKEDKGNKATVVAPASEVRSTSSGKSPPSVPITSSSFNKIDSKLTYTCRYGNTTLVVPVNTPTFIMVGVQKSGTTALLTYFRDHPQILQTKKKFTRELHFFDTSWNSIMNHAKSMGLVQANEKNCFILEKYMALFETESLLEHYQNQTEALLSSPTQPQLFTFEKTPSYFANPMIAKRMKQIVPWSKIILILRNPIDRLYSQYKMTIKDVFDMRQYSLEDLLQHELMAMKYSFHMTNAPLLLGEEETVDIYQSKHSTNVVAATTPPHVPYNHSVAPQNWTPAHKSLAKYSDHGPLGHHILIRRGLYAIQLKWWLQHWELDKNLLVIHYADMKADTQAVYEQILTFCGIPIVENPNASSNKAVRADERKDHRPLLNSTRRYLQEFFAPYNAELESLLGPEWSVDRLGW